MRSDDMEGFASAILYLDLSTSGVHSSDVYVLPNAASTTMVSRGIQLHLLLFCTIMGFAPPTHFPQQFSPCSTVEVQLNTR